MSKYDIIADLHTHTISSKHAFSTIKENITSAKEHGMKYIAITDHLYYSDDIWERRNEMSRLINLKKLNKVAGFNVIAGVETNLFHYIPNIPDRNKIINSCKWRLVGMHSWFLEPNTVSMQDVPQLYEDTLKDKALIRPTAFAHIERGFPNDDKAIKALKEIVDIAIDNAIYLEINEDSLKRKNVTALAWAKYAKEKGAMFCLGTDAHYCDQVGVFTEALQFLDAVGIPADHILNCDEDALKEML